jgi:hypothetical protein
MYHPCGFVAETCRGERLDERNGVTSREDFGDLYCSLNIVTAMKLKTTTGCSCSTYGKNWELNQLFGGKNFVRLKYFGMKVTKKENLL